MKNKFVELAKQKEMMIDNIYEQIQFESVRMIEDALKDLDIEYQKLFNYMYKFEILGVEFWMISEKCSYQVKISVHNMTEDINLMNNEIGKSDRVGTGLSYEGFKSRISDAISRVCPDYKPLNE